MEYSDKVVDHYTNPGNVGKIEDASGIGEVGNPVCGDIMKMFIKVENGIITDVKFKTFGCGAAIATSSISTEMIKGKSLEEALALKNGDVVSVKVTGTGREIVFGDTVVRVKSRFALAMHIDTDESDAGNCFGEVYGELIK